MCGFHSFDAPYPIEEEGDMGLEMYKSIIDEGAKEGLCSVKLNFRGEPLLYPYLTEAVAYAKERGIIDVMFNTNGSLLTYKHCIDLLKAGLDKIMFSIDEHRTKPYAKLRPPGTFSKVYKNIQNLVVLRELFQLDHPQIEIHRIDFNENRDVKDEFHAYFVKMADVVGDQLHLDYHNTRPDRTPSEWICAFPWQRLVILANGDILSCCGMPDKGKKIGNVSEMSIKTAWHSSHMEHIRELHSKKQSHRIPSCAICPVRKKVIHSP